MPLAPQREPFSSCLPRETKAHRLPVILTSQVLGESGIFPSGVMGMFGMEFPLQVHGKGQPREMKERPLPNCFKRTMLWLMGSISVS